MVFRDNLKSVYEVGAAFGAPGFVIRCSGGTDRRNMSSQLCSWQCRRFLDDRCGEGDQSLFELVCF
jgi:hypothetical protein